ncbi:type VI secretion system-associated FHA domain protein TagH [Azospirillum palustre]|nr:type VI secretion system-associated FHA domain protein TagH [Azospirillum palustre]
MLTLRITKGRLCGAVRTLTRTGLIVGRGSACDWILPDVDCILSNQHFRISWVDGQYVLTDTSSNGVYHNRAEHPIGRGGSVALADGDSLVLGDYEMAVSVGQAADPVALSPWDEAVFQDSLESPFYAGGEAEPFSGLRTPATPPAATHPDHVPLDRSHFQPPNPIEALPDDWLESLGIPQQPSSGKPEAAPLPFELDAFDPEALRRDAAAQPAPTAPAPMADADRPAFPPPPLSSTPLPPPPVSPVSPPPVAPPAGLEPDPPAARPPAPPPVHAASPAAPPAVADDGALLAAFLDGAGLPPAALSGTDPVAAMRLAGGIYRQMVEGLAGLLAVRASLKNEFRIDRTTIGVRNNNPLKFSPDPASTAQQLLEAPRPGFMPGDAAVREGFRDLQQHELATSVGMHSALSALLRRFDPATLKERLDRQSLLASILPAARRARYWELYEGLYKQIVAEAEDDFQSLFGREFAQAYERQVRSLSTPEDQPPGTA